MQNNHNITIMQIHVLLVSCASPGFTQTAGWQDC